MWAQNGFREIWREGKPRNAFNSASSQKEVNGLLIVRRLLAGDENSRERIMV